MRRTLKLLLATVAAAATTVLPAVGQPAGTPAAAETPSAPSAPAASVAQGAEEVGTEETVTVRLGRSAPSHTIARPGAWYVKVHVTGLHLAPGDVLTVSDPTGREVHTYSADPTRRAPGDSLASPDATGFWALSITGDTAVVSLRGRDGGAPSPASRATVDRLTRGFTEAEFAERRAVQPFSICGSNNYQDVACYRTSNPVEYAKTPPVARLLMDGRSLCTGWRVGPNNRMLTNNHCFSTTTIAQRTEVWFNYQCTTCGGSTSAPVTKVLANTVLSTNSALDYTLFDVQNFSAVSGFGYLELDARVPDVGEEMYIIQHPGGQMKKLALRDDQTSTGNCQVRAVRVNGSSAQSDFSYYCDTEGGSSGSPVLSRRTHKVIGLHHYGGCPNQAVHIDLIAQRIGSLL